MPRILAIDYGLKRTGIAVTDPLQMIATALDTVATHDLMAYLQKYLAAEEVESFVVGEAKRLNNQDTHATKPTDDFVKRLNKVFPNKPVYRVDERFTSKMAKQTMLDGGLKKQDRRNKALLDSISATLILQTFMEQKNI
ncbi:MAG: Holliday junction resolvase RuvX [Bacteroidota bacterium]